MKKLLCVLMCILLMTSACLFVTSCDKGEESEESKETSTVESETNETRETNETSESSESEVEDVLDNTSPLYGYEMMQAQYRAAILDRDSGEVVDYVEAGDDCYVCASEESGYYTLWEGGATNRELIVMEYAFYDDIDFIETDLGCPILLYASLGMDISSSRSYDGEFQSVFVSINDEYYLWLVKIEDSLYVGYYGSEDDAYYFRTGTVYTDVELENSIDLAGRINEKQPVFLINSVTSEASLILMETEFYFVSENELARRPNDLNGDGSIGGPEDSGEDEEDEGNELSNGFHAIILRELNVYEDDECEGDVIGTLADNSECTFTIVLNNYGSRFVTVDKTNYRSYFSDDYLTNIVSFYVNGVNASGEQVRGYVPASEMAALYRDVLYEEFGEYYYNEVVDGIVCYGDVSIYSDDTCTTVIDTITEANASNVLSASGLSGGANSSSAYYVDVEFGVECGGYLLFELEDGNYGVVLNDERVDFVYLARDYHYQEVPADTVISINLITSYDDVQVRSCPSFDSEVVYELGLGEHFVSQRYVRANHDNALGITWYEYSANGITGYVSEFDVVKIRTNADSSIGTNTYVINSTNVYAEPNTSSNVIATLPAQEPVTIIGIKDGFYVILGDTQIQNEVGTSNYILTSYTLAYIEITSCCNYYGAVIDTSGTHELTCDTFIRVAPDMNSEIIAELSSGEEIMVLGDVGSASSHQPIPSYYLVEYNGVRGFISLSSIYSSGWDNATSTSTLVDGQYASPIVGFSMASSEILFDSTTLIDPGLNYNEYVEGVGFVCCQEIYEDVDILGSAPNYNPGSYLRVSVDLTPAQWAFVEYAANEHSAIITVSNGQLVIPEYVREDYTSSYR